MTNGASTDDRVLSWLRGQTESAESVESAATEDVTMEPLVITVSAQRREALLRRAGWVPVDFQFMLRDFNNVPIRGFLCFFQFVGPRGETNTNRVEVEGGIASFPRFWTKPNGVLRLFTVPIAGTRYEGWPLIEGTVAVPGHIPGGYGVFTATQESDIIQIRAADQHQVSEQLTASGNVKFSILEVVELGGGLSHTGGSSQTTTAERLYSVRIGRPTFAIVPASR